MELRQLRVFLAVAEAQSFTAAAEQVNLVQSAVSVAIRTLEGELGTALFHRTTRKVELTTAGEALVAPARATLAAAAAARDAVDAATDGTRGTISMGIMHALPGLDLASVISRMRHERPGVRILPRTHPEGSAGMLREVGEHTLDVAFVATTPETSARFPELEITEMCREPMRLLCPPGHEFEGRDVVEFRELDGLEFVDTPVSWGNRASTDRFFAAHGLDREVVVEVGDVPTVAELVRAGLGLAVLAPSSGPDSLVPRYVDLRPHPEFTVSMAVSRERPLPAVIDYLRTVARRQLGRD